MRIAYSRRARHDLDQIWIYITHQSGNTASADRILDSILDSCHLIRRSPYIGRRRDEDISPGLRSYPSGNYVIFYRVASGTVRIARILHGRRNLRAILGTQ